MSARVQVRVTHTLHPLKIFLREKKGSGYYLPSSPITDKNVYFPRGKILDQLNGMYVIKIGH